LLLILSSVNFSSVKLVNAAPGDLVNYNNNFNMYTSPNDPNKDSAMRNANCVVNFMQTYVYAASSANNCNSTPAPTPTTPADQTQTPLQSQSPVQSQTYSAAPEGPQTGVTSQGESIGIVKVVDSNANNEGTFAPVQTTSSAITQNNPEEGNDKDARDKDDDDNDNDKDARDKDDDDNDNDKDARDKDDDDNDNDKDSETKVYNENTVTKQERKLLLTACFERAYDKGEYLSTKEIAKCAENYNS
jgi:hypothetical protein